MLNSTRRSTSLPTRNSRNVLLVSQAPPPPSTQLTRSSSTNATLPATSRAPQPGAARVRLGRSYSAEGQLDGPARVYLTGTRLECKIPTWNKYYPGRVAAVNPDGTLMVAFDDGDLRDCIQLAHVFFDNRVTSSNSPARIVLEVGNQIEWCNDQRWYPGRISEVLAYDRFTIVLCDQRVIRDASRDQLRVYVPFSYQLIAGEELEFLLPQTRIWVKAQVDETRGKLKYFDDATQSQAAISLPIECRYPIVNIPPRQAEDEDCLDATPMILSMQERLSQSIEVGAHILITDKNGGALPKTGRADSAQVSIINFPLPADGIIESVSLKLFEPPAEENNQLDVILFDREQTPATRTNRLSSTESSNDEGGNSPVIGGVNGSAAAVEPQVARFYVAPDLPYRPSGAFINVDPHSRGVQTMKLSVPLRGSAGQYLGLMNRKGRLNIAYTPDKKKPGESWSEKSVEVYYMMPRMVSKPFVGGPHSTRDWHGRAGWYAVMTVSDPVDAIDPGWQRRCVIDALSRRDGQVQMPRVCWVITTLVKENRLSAEDVLFRNPAVMQALRRLCEVDESVVQLVTQLCLSASSSSTLQKQNPKSLRPFVRLQRALRFKAWEMQAVQRGRLAANVASFQSILKCSLAMKSLLAQVCPPRKAEHQPFLEMIRVALQPRAADAPPPITYHLKAKGVFLVEKTDLPRLRSEMDQLVLQEDDSRDFYVMLHTTGPVTDTELFFHRDSSQEMIQQWQQWTNPVVNVFRCTKRERVLMYEDVLAELSGTNNNEHEKKSSIPRDHGAVDWLDELGRATELLSAFAMGQPPSSSFVREQLVLWRQKQSRVRVESARPWSSSETSESGQVRKIWNVSIPGASRLKLEWLPQSRLQETDCLCIALFACETKVFGRNGLPPPIERVEGSSVDLSIEPAQPFDPAVIVKHCREAELKTFPPAMGLRNSAGDVVFTVVDRNGEAKLACAKCFRGSVVEGSCCEGMGAPENNEGRYVTPFPTRGTWTCSACAGQQTPCAACAAYPQSAAFGTARVREVSSFTSIAKYEQYMRKYLVPNVPVRILSAGPNSPIRKFSRFISDVAVTQALNGNDPSSSPLSDLCLVPDAMDDSQSPTQQQRVRFQEQVQMLGSGETQQSSGAMSPDWAASMATRGGTFATNDLGPDIVISNNGLTVTRVRSLGWGTQRMSKYLDSSCGVTTITFRIDRNTSNHLFFGVVAPSFDDWNRRMMEPGAWSIRRDGSIHADGRERSNATLDARLVTGEILTMVIDMSSDPKSVTFIRNGTVLGKLQGLPPRVVPAVSFGGSNQIVSITSFHIGGTTAFAGKQPAEWGFALDITPQYDSVDEKDEREYLAGLMKWTAKHDRTLVCYLDEMVQERKMTLSEIIASDWSSFVRSSGRSHFLDALSQEGITPEAISQRFEWIRAFNASIASALHLMDLSFEDQSDTAVVRHLSHCSHLLLDILKRPMWEDALECTRTEEGQFEVVLDYGKALAHRQFVDVHGRFSIFGQAFRVMNAMPPSRLRGRGQLYRATLRGMRAHDDGGPYRQSFQTYCAELLSIPGVGLFLPCANRVNEIHVNRDRWLPNPGARSAVQIAMFEFVGKLMGIALRNHEYLDLRLPSLVWKWLVNRQPTMEDLRAVDLLFANTIQELTEMSKDDHADVWGDDHALNGIPPPVINFTVFSLDGRSCELVPNGEQRLVSFAADRAEWVKLATDFKLNEFREQLEAIRRGLAMVVPQRMLVLFTWEELELMVCGRPKIDLALLKEMTVYVGCSESDPHVIAFWKVLMSFPEETRSLYLRFVWGRSRLPASKATWGDAPHKISSFEVSSRSQTSVDTDSLLPRSHTCYFSLDLPRYSSEEVLRKKLLFAIENCTEIDADQTTTGNRSAALGFDLDIDPNEVVEAATPTANQQLDTEMSVEPYMAALASDQARRLSQSSFGSDFEDDFEEVCEAEVEVLARLGHDLEAVNVFEFEGAIDFGEDDSST